MGTGTEFWLSARASVGDGEVAQQLRALALKELKFDFQLLHGSS